MHFEPAADMQETVTKIISKLRLNHIDASRIICVRSYGSKSRANARVWGLPRIWQKALKIKSYYIIEALSERFDRHNKETQEKILIHELLHIPKTFSGALVPHFCFGKRIDKNAVEKLFNEYKK